MVNSNFKVIPMFILLQNSHCKNLVYILQVQRLLTDTAVFLTALSRCSQSPYSVDSKIHLKFDYFSPLHHRSPEAP